MYPLNEDFVDLQETAIMRVLILGEAAEDEVADEAEARG